MQNIRCQLLAIFFAVVFFAPAVAAPLTAQDYMEINQLYAAYAKALDTNDGAGEAALYAPGGTFADAGSGHKPQSAATLAKSAGAKQMRPAGGHMLMNLWINPTADGATGQTYSLVVSEDDSGTLDGYPALYNDTLVKTRAGWRFRSREIWTGKEKMPPPDFNAVKNDKFVPDSKAIALPNQAIKALTPEDYFEIQQLYAKYAFATDEGDGPMRATVFTADGVITSNLTDHKPGTMADMVQRTGRIGRQVRPMGGHIMSNISLTPTLQGVRGVAYAYIGGKPGELKGTPIVYNDLIVRTPVGWRIKARNIWLDNEKDSPFHPGACARAPCGPLSPFSARKNDP